MGFSTIQNSTEIDANYNSLIETIKSSFGENSDRTIKLLKMYADFEERVKETPASGKINFHNAFPGGYLAHILNVLRVAKKVSKLYELMGGTVDYTEQELVFSALHHDLGKLGTLEEPYYIIQDSDWHRKNRLEAYKINDDRQYMKVSDLTVFNLQKYGIEVTQNEYLAMKLTDGLYDKANEDYLRQYGAGPFPMRCNLGRVMHWADSMAAFIENDAVRAKYVR